MKNRSGSYKKVLISEGQLSLHQEKLINCIEAMQKSSLTPFEFCTLYIILFLRLKHPKNWLQKKSSVSSHLINDKKVLDLIPSSFELNGWEKLKLENVSFYEFFINFNLKGIPLASNRTMLNWLQANWPIICLHHIPTPRELLKMQANGSRCITLIINPDEISKMVLSSRDPLSFVIHDLDHADHFFNNDETHKGQLGILRLIDSIYDRPEIKKSLRENHSFKNEFNYVASDMNAYAIHMFKCLKSAFDRHDQSLFNLVLNWWNVTPEVSSAAHRLSTPEFSQYDEDHLKTFFEEVLV